MGQRADRVDRLICLVADNDVTSAARYLPQ
jgi:hypothetical protein